MSQLNWTEAQWNKVNSAIAEEFTKGSVAGACLPCYGPVGAGVESVSKQEINPDPNKPRLIRVSDGETTPFWTIRVYVELNSQQVADETLSSALYAFKRAANLLARTEDYIVFLGYDAKRKTSPNQLRFSPSDLPDGIKTIHSVIANESHKADGLLTHDRVEEISVSKSSSQSDGERLVKTVAAAISKLEGNGYPGPFASVLGQNLFLVAQTPNESSLVLPADRITPLLGGPLLRSGSMSKSHGVVASSCGESLDIVVATPPKAQFLHINEDAKYVFRVYERFVLRIKDSEAVVSISLG